VIDENSRRRGTRPLLDRNTGPRRHWVDTPDHVRLHMMEFPRDGVDAVLLLPGFHRRAETPTHLAMAQRLAGHAAVYSLDFRGHGRSLGRYSFGLAEEEDVLTALRFLRAAGRERIFVVGLSMGGYVATKALGARPGEFRVRAPASSPRSSR
jgi:alpha-beta hydrolase superfamily lysophospholipase